VREFGDTPVAFADSAGAPCVGDGDIPWQVTDR
jgi:hypothetical protein